MTLGSREILLAFLHDPPDKALSVAARGQVASHESRGLYLAKALLGDDEVSRNLMKKVAADVDVMAATVERLPMPKEPHVNVENRQLRIVHPLVGSKEPEGFIELRVPELNQSLLDAERDHLLAVVQNLPGDGDRLYVEKGTRFIRALSFCRRRRNVEVRGDSRMFRISFGEPHAPRRPFAVGDQCHFGLGLFMPENTALPYS